MNAPRRDFKRVQERHYSAHHALVNIASTQLDQAENDVKNNFDNCLVSLTFSALAAEAFANAVGDRLVPEWKDFEALSPNSKLRLLAERLTLPYDASLEPWRTLRWLGRFRNNIVHPKPEQVREELRVTAAQADDRFFMEPPASKLEREVTLSNARRASKAVLQAIELIRQRIPIEEHMGLITDGWTISTERAETGVE